MKNTILAASFLCLFLFTGCSGPEPGSIAGDVIIYDSGELFPMSLSDSNFGIYSETIPLSVNWGIDAVTQFWTNSSGRMALGETTNSPGEGRRSWQVIGTGNMTGLSVNVNPITALKDMRFYTNGYLKFLYRGTKPVRIGIGSGGLNPVSKMLVMTNGKFGYYTNNNWCSVTLPLSLFTGVDFSKIEWYFMAMAVNLPVTTLPAETFTPYFSLVQLTTFMLDNIYWSAPVPLEVIDTNKAFVLYSDELKQNVTWGNEIRLNQAPSSPNILSFVSNTAADGKESFQIKVLSNMFEVNFLRYPLVSYLDLSAYSNGTLRMKIKGTKYISVSIHMVANYDIMVHLTNDGLYGYYTNNTWCNVVIPMSEYLKKGLNLSYLYGWLKFYGGYYEKVTGGEEYYIDRVYFYK